MNSARANILIIDDEAKNRKLLRALLAAEGYRTLEAERGAEGLATLEQESVDLVVCDVMMPGMDGVEVVRRIKDRPETRHIPVVVLTSLQDSQVRRSALRAGAEDFLSRPIDREELSARVRNLCKLKLLGDELRTHKANLEQIVASRTAQLAERERHYRTLVETVPDTILVVNEAGRIEFVNRGLAGVELDGEGGTTALEQLDETGPGTIRAAWQSVLATGDTCDCRLELPGADGNPCFYRGLAAPLDGSRVLILLRDITESVNLEEQLRQSQKMEAIGQLAGGVAHDFNNLLTGIIAFAGFVRDSLPDGDPRRDDIRQVLGAADRAAGLTRQLLMFSRRQPTDPQPIDLNATLERISTLLRRLIGEDIELKVLRASDVAPVFADTTHIDQILLNLAVNAKDAMPGGGVISIGVDPVELDGRDILPVLGLEAGRYVRLTVADSGVGMDAATQARIFEPFFTTKGPGKGTGLGLATSYGLVQQMGGAVAVESSPGHGTTFTIYLPRFEGVVEDYPGVQPRCISPDKADETVLVVEDETVVRRVAVRTLCQRGHKVYEASDADEAWAIFEAHGGEIDLVFSDIVLPRGSGPELARRVRARAPELPVLLTSGYAEEVAATNQLDGAIPILWKPYTPDELLHAARSALNRRPAAEGDAPPPPHGKVHVLVVDDEHHIRAALVRLLTQNGYSVTGCGSVAEARAAFSQSSTIDVVLCDLQIGRDSGLELLSWLGNEHPAVAERALLFTGGEVDPETSRLLRDQGDRLVRKPVHPGELISRIQEVCNTGPAQSGGRS